MNEESGMAQTEDLIKTFCTNGGWKRYCEGMACDETSLGSVEDGLYLGRKESRVFLLQES
jgi:hypothetical protein